MNFVVGIYMYVLEKAMYCLYVHVCTMLTKIMN